MPGYSPKSLAAKLGIAEGCAVYPIGAPKEYGAILAPLPDNVRFVARVAASTDIVHIFSSSSAELHKHLSALRTRIKPDAAVWVSWPKKASKMPTDLTEDVIRSVALPMGFVDVTVCAVTDVWSGLKLVIRKELRGKK